MNERTRLERAAIAGHAAGTSWSTFWTRHGAEVGQAEPWDNVAYRRLVNRLSHLLVCGNADGMTAAGDAAPWEQDDEPSYPASDDRTAARLLWSPAAQAGRAQA